MKKIGIVVVVLVVVLTGAVGLYFSGSFDQSPADVETAAIGQPAPDFTLKDVNGREFRLSSMRGKVVLVNFWATWCPPCRSEIPSMDQLYANYGKGPFELLAINIEPDGPDIMEEFSKEFPHSFPVLFDIEADVQQKYGVFKFPETFVVNKQGIIVDKVVGAIDWTEPDVLASLNNLIREQ